MLSFWWAWPGMPKVLKKKLRHEVEILHADENENESESLLQIDTIIFDGVGHACPKHLDKFGMSLCHLKRS